MKKTLSIIAFIVVAVAIVVLALWYNQKSDQAAQQAEIAATDAVQQAQTQLMANLKINDVTVGTGATAQNGDTVTVNYVGTLDDGTKFDSSYDRKQPFSFVLGAAQVTIPPDLGYGAQGAGNVIPPNATLHFTVELLSVSTSSAAAGQ